MQSVQVSFGKMGVPLGQVVLMARRPASKLIGWLAALFGAGLVAVACGGSNGDPAVAPNGDDAGSGGGATGDDAGDASAVVVQGPCAPWDVRADGQCQTPPFNQFAWYGGACAAFPCFACAGADCGRRYISASGCDGANAACYGLSGITRACAADADCTIAPRVCCPCGALRADDLIGVRPTEVDALHASVCRGVGGCSECAMTIDPLVHAVCMNGRCLATR
jgi:hypothetical protein